MNDEAARVTTNRLIQRHGENRTEQMLEALMDADSPQTSRTVDSLDTENITSSVRSENSDVDSL